MYRAHPSAWKVKPGEKASRVAVYFRWYVVGSPELEPVLTEQRNDAVRSRGVSLPEILSSFAAVAACSVWCAQALEALQQAGRAFEARYEPELLREFGMKVQRTYAA